MKNNVLVMLMVASSLMIAAGIQAAAKMAVEIPFNTIRSVDYSGPKMVGGGTQALSVQLQSDLSNLSTSSTNPERGTIFIEGCERYTNAACTVTRVYLDPALQAVGEIVAISGEVNGGRPTCTTSIAAVPAKSPYKTDCPLTGSFGYNLDQQMYRLDYGEKPRTFHSTATTYDELKAGLGLPVYGQTQTQSMPR